MVDALLRTGREYIRIVLQGEILVRNLSSSCRINRSRLGGSPQQKATCNQAIAFENVFSLLTRKDAMIPSEEVSLESALESVCLVLTKWEIQPDRE